jgi:hypothetical protein
MKRLKAVRCAVQERASGRTAKAIRFRSLYRNSVSFQTQKKPRYASRLAGARQDRFSNHFWTFDFTEMTDVRDANGFSNDM